MSRKELGYKRIVQYFWDPEPKNDSPSNSPIWCLGQRYGSDRVIHRRTSSSKRNVSLSGDNTTETAVGSCEESNHMPTNGEENRSIIQSRLTEEERGWPLDFLDDFEARFWFTYRSNFAPIKKSNDPPASASVTFAVRLRSQFLDQGAFSSDTGWGCMIRSGQSLLANALATLRLGRGAMHPSSEPRFEI